MQVRKLKSHLSRLLPWSHGSCELKAVAVSTDDPPLRVGLLNLEQLDRHARVIAGTHRLATGPADDKLLPRLAENERILIATYDLIAAATAKELRIAPAAEWLLDNFYLIEEQIRSTRRLLPRSYSSELPRIASGRERLSPSICGRPRVDFSYGWPNRFSNTECLPDGLPICCSAETGRALGDSADAAAGSD